MKENKIEKPLIETSNQNAIVTVKTSDTVGAIATKVYFVVIVAFMFAVYIWALVCNIVANDAEGIINAVKGFAAVFFCGLILIISVFGLWYKLFSIIFRKKKKSEVDTPKEEKDILNEKLFIYRDYVRLEQNGSVQEAPLNSIIGIEIEQDEFHYLIFFNTHNDVLCATLPKRSYLIKRIKKIFDCPIRIIKNSNVDDNGKMPMKDLIGGIVMSLITVAVGIMLVVMHYLWFDSVPAFLGIMFIVGGIAVFVGVVGRNSKWENIIVPLMFAVIIFALFVGLSITYMNELQISFVRVFVAQPYMTSVIGLCGCAAYLVFVSVVNAIDLIVKRIKRRRGKK